MAYRILACLAVACFANAALAQYGDISDLKLKKPEDKVDVKSVPAPKGAKVLFDGKSLDGWGKRGKPTEKAGWKLVAGGVMEGNRTGDIVTKETFDGKFLLHVEFRVPYEPKNSGQGKGNSGVYVQGRYEVQVLDSYGLKSGKSDCAAIYGIAAPTVNVCKAPTVWQSYDITFTAPKFDGKKKVAAARMTVFHNGVKVHDNVEITSDNTTAGMGGDVSKPGPIMLQDHGHPVQYRNIWIKPIKD
jgi:hypothetical protein